MKFTCNREKLSRAIIQAARLIPSRSELPILTNLLIKAESGKVSLFATNLQLSIASQIAAKVEITGETTVPAIPVQNYISSLSSSKVTLNFEDQKLKIDSDSSKASFVTMESIDYPAFPKMQEEPLVVFKVEELARLIKKVTFSAGMDENRPVLTGILVRIVNNDVTFTSTDGFRLSEINGSTLKSKEEEIKLIIPVGAFNEVEKLLGSCGEEEVRIFLSDDRNQVLFDFVTVQLASRLLEAEYPDYQAILPSDFKLKVILSKEEVLRAVKLAAIFSQRDGQTVYLSFKEKSMIIEAKSSEVGEGREEIDVKLDGEPFRMAFNSDFLREGIEVIDSDEVVFEAVEPLKAVSLSSPADESFFHIIMPIRVEEDTTS